MGRVTAAALAARGATVFALDLPASIANAPEIEGVQYVEADVTDPAQVAAAVQTAAAAAPLRTVVNCAGIDPLRASSARRACTTSTSTPRSSGST